MSERVPKGWKNLLVNEVFEVGRGRVISKDEIRDNFGPYPVFSSQSTNNGKMGSIRTFDFEGEYITWTTDGAYAGTVFYRTGKFNCTNVCGTLRNTGVFKLDMRFVAEYLSTVAKKHVSYVGNPKLMNGVFGEIEFLLPPFSEQKKIASILTSVDEVIENTKKQIDKLQDLKKATMNELLTKGIGHTEFKDTELGRIPKSWKLGLVGEYSSLVTNGFVGSAVQHYRSEGIPYLVSKNIRDNYIDERGLTYISKEFHEKTAKSQLKIGDLLTVQSGHVGSSAVVSQKFNGANCHALILTRFDHNLINSDFVAYYFNSQIGRLRLSNYFVGSTIVHLNTSDLKKFKFPIPNLSEQVEVVTIIKSIERQISFCNNKLTHTKYLKKSLMQDLLTGKVRVSVN